MEALPSASRVNLARALRQTAITALIAFGLLLPPDYERDGGSHHNYRRPDRQLYRWHTPSWTELLGGRHGAAQRKPGRQPPGAMPADTVRFAARGAGRKWNSAVAVDSNVHFGGGNLTCHHS